MLYLNNNNVRAYIYYDNDCAISLQYIIIYFRVGFRGRPRERRLLLLFLSLLSLLLLQAVRLTQQ